jgi:hypothetical protein
VPVAHHPLDIAPAADRGEYRQAAGALRKRSGQSAQSAW